MKRKKLLKTLAALLDKEGRKQRKHRDGLEALLAKLKGKEIELEQKLRAEKDGQKQQRLSTELEIVRAQRTKGIETLQGLDES